jgi:hypothetical protein
MQGLRDCASVPKCLGKVVSIPGAPALPVQPPECRVPQTQAATTASWHRVPQHCVLSASTSLLIHHVQISAPSPTALHLEWVQS